jgi:Flp pilus assembly protein TadG
MVSKVRRYRRAGIAETWHYMKSSKSTSRNRLRRLRRRGASAVELALVAPIFLMLLGGIIEFGQVYHAKHVISTAARRGVRMGSLAGSTGSQVIAAARSECTTALGVKSADVTVTVKVNGSSAEDPSSAVAGDAINVAVSIPFSKCGVGFFNNLFKGKTISSQCTFEHE